MPQVADEDLEKYGMTFIEGQQLTNRNDEWIRTEDQLLDQTWYMVCLITSSYDEFVKNTQNKTMLAEEYATYCMPHIKGDLQGGCHLNWLVKTAKKHFNCSEKEVITKCLNHAWDLSEQGVYIVNDITEAIDMLEVVEDKLVYPERWFSPLVYKKISELLKTFDYTRTKYKGRVAYKQVGEFTTEHVIHVAKELKGVSLSTEFDFFPTPKEVVEKVQYHAQLEDGLRILEPSAGTGSLLVGIEKNNCYCVEFNKVLHSILIGKGYNPTKVYNIEFENFHLHGFDRVLMNPPFGKRMDAKHIVKAFKEHLAEGGILVAIHSSSIITASDKYSKEFQDIYNMYGVYQEKIDSGAFKDSGKGTMVETYITKLVKR